MMKPTMLLLALGLLAVVFATAVFAATDGEAADSANAGGSGEKDNAHLVEARASQSKIDELTSQMMEEMSKLETQTHKKKIPIFATRNNILKSVKGFWSRVIESHPSHLNWLRGNDREALTYLRDITVEDIAGESDYQLHQYRVKMEFGPNPFFSDSVLWREIHGSIEDAQKTSGVHWMAGKEPAEPSFFSFFEDPAARPEQKLDMHVLNDIAHVVRYEFFPNPFTYHDLPNYNDYVNQDLGGTFDYGSEEDHTHEYPPPPSDEIPSEALNVEPNVETGVDASDASASLAEPADLQHEEEEKAVPAAEEGKEDM